MIDGVNDKFIKQYIREINSYPLLSADEEKYIATNLRHYDTLVKNKKIDNNLLAEILKKYDYKKTIKTDLFSRRMQLNFLIRNNASDHDIDCFSYFINYLSFREKLFNSNLRLVVRVAKKKWHTSNDFFNYVQWGNLGLLKAVDNYEPKRNVRFMTYAYPCIKTSIISNSFMEADIPKSLYDNNYLAKQFSDYIEDYYSNYGCYPNEDEKLDFICNARYPNRSNMSKEKLEKIKESCKKTLAIISRVNYLKKTLYLDALNKNDDEIGIADVLPDELVDVEKEATAYDLKERFREVFKYISTKNLCILLLRNGIGINDYISFEDFQKVFNNIELKEQIRLYYCKDVITSKEIADHLGYTKQNISSIEIRTKQKIKNYKGKFQGYIN